MKARGESVHSAQVERQEIEEQRALVIGGDREEAATALRRQPIVELTEVGGLASQPRAAIDDLEMNLARPMVDQRHQVGSVRAGRATTRRTGRPAPGPPLPRMPRPASPPATPARRSRPSRTARGTP